MTIIARFRERIRSIDASVFALARCAFARVPGRAIFAMVLGRASLTAAIVVLATTAFVLALLLLAQRLGPFPAVVTFAVFAFPLTVGLVAAARAQVSLRRELERARSYAEQALELRGQNIPIDGDTPRRFGAGALAATLAARIAGRVALAGAEGRYEPVASIIALDLPLLRAGSNSVRRSQLFAIRFGILTTFAGLMWGLFEIAPLVQNVDAAAKADAVNNIVREMTTAFGGSVAGLLAATLLQFVAGAVENEESRLLAAVEQAILGIQSYYYHSFTRDPVIKALHQFNAGINEFDAHLQDGRREILDGVETLKTSIRGQDAKLASRLDQLAAGRDALTQLIDQQSASLRQLEKAFHIGTERIAADIRAWVDAQVQTAAAQAMEATAARSQAALREHADRVEKSILAGMDKSNETLHRLATLLERAQRAQSITSAAGIALVALVAAAFAVQCFAFVWWVIPFVTRTAS